MQGEERRLPTDVAQLLAPNQRRALDHPMRRQILRALGRSRDAQTLESLATMIPGGYLSGIAYHALVLEECDCVSITVVLTANGAPERAYASTVGENRIVTGALQATRQLDEHGH